MKRLTYALLFIISFCNSRSVFSDQETTYRQDIPHFEKINEIQPKKSLFFQSNIGVGFLYFSGLKGNLAGAPAQIFQFASASGSGPMAGRLSYNRTPLYEYLVGRRLNSWFKLALSYQYQGGVTVQTELLPGYTNAVLRPQLTADLSLNAIMAKFYFEFPFPLVNKNRASTLYLGAGVGSGWQSWTRIYDNLEMTDSTANFQGAPIQLRQKISANAVWMLDFGFRMQRARPSAPLSFTVGCKYNQWGQARNIGKASQHGAYRSFIFKPFAVKTVYQFAPYLGFQWSFPSQYTSKSPYMVDGRSTFDWDIFFIKGSKIQGKGSVWTQFNAGLGLLYFSGVSGLFPKQPISPNVGPTDLKNAPSYNRTPLFEYLIGYQLFSWMKPAFSYQYQSGVTVSTNPLPSFNVAGSNYTNAQMISYLSLNALAFKLYLELPYPMILRGTATTPYLAIGVGPSWQTWSRVRMDSVNATVAATFYHESHLLALRQKISANAFFLLDLGITTKSATPNSPYSLMLGCKYNQWGQARNIGLLSKQGSLKYASGMEFKIKNVYQFAPYLGFQWNFLPSCVDKSTYKLGNKSPNRWSPYFTHTSNLQRREWIWTQFNAGIGFLYFSGVRGNFMLQPPGNLTRNDGHRDAPLKGHLSYNRTPLFEYQLGSTILSSMRISLSFMHQGGITVQTQELSTFSGRNDVGEAQAIFTSNLSLNAFLAKFYYEIPYTFVMKNISTTPYIAAGVGPGWQTWNRNTVEYNAFIGDYTTALLNIRQKICANAVWMIDLGFRFQSAFPDAAFNIVAGCKYNEWGQARNIGLLEQQGNATNKFGFFKPFRVKTVYQFAPYLGVQWNF